MRYQVLLVLFLSGSFTANALSCRIFEDHLKPYFVSNSMFLREEGVTRIGTETVLSDDEALRLQQRLEQEIIPQITYDPSARWPWREMAKKYGYKQIRYRQARFFRTVVGSDVTEKIFDHVERLKWGIESRIGKKLRVQRIRIRTGADRIVLDDIIGSAEKDADGQWAIFGGHKHRPEDGISVTQVLKRGARGTGIMIDGEIQYGDFNEAIILTTAWHFGLHEDRLMLLINYGYE